MKRVGSSTTKVKCKITLVSLTDSKPLFHMQHFLVYFGFCIIMLTASTKTKKLIKRAQNNHWHYQNSWEFDICGTNLSSSKKFRHYSAESSANFSKWRFEHQNFAEFPSEHIWQAQWKDREKIFGQFLRYFLEPLLGWKAKWSRIITMNARCRTWRIFAKIYVPKISPNVSLAVELMKARFTGWIESRQDLYPMVS